MLRETEMSDDVTNYIVLPTAQACHVSLCTELFPVLRGTSAPLLWSGFMTE